MITHIRAASRQAVMGAAVAIVVAILLALTAPAAPAESAAPQRPASPAETTREIPKCTAPDLGVWVAVGQADAAAGTMYMPLEFTNLSGHACTLRGLPRVSAIGHGGQQIGSPATWDHAVTARTVRLFPGATAYALLEYSDVITCNCPSASRGTAFELRVYPPGQHQADRALWGLPACAAKGSSVFMRVRVIAPGIGIRGDVG